MRQIPLALGPEPTRSFDNFTVGVNAVVLAHLRQLHHQLLTGGPPLFLWGPGGVGKTHLLHALAQQWQSLGAKVAKFDAQTPLPWEPDEDVRLVLLDNCERFCADRQHAAFALFVEAATLNMTVVGTGNCPAVDLPVREDLRTRLGWGPVFEVQALGEDQSRAVLRREADRRGIHLSDDVMSYLLTRFARDLSHLMHLLDRLDEFALSQKRGVTVPLLKQMLRDEENEESP